MTVACVFRHAQPAPQCGYKRRRVQTHISFSLRSRAFQHESPRVSARQQTALVLSCVSKARALGQTMSTLVVQERHLWLTLGDMREANKHRFLDSPISQAGLFGEVVEGFAQQFSATQKQMEAFCHILPWR